jgi:muramidase (phage lysozyme)
LLNLDGYGVNSCSTLGRNLPIDQEKAPRQDFLGSRPDVCLSTMFAASHSASTRRRVAVAVASLALTSSAALAAPADDGLPVDAPFETPEPAETTTTTVAETSSTTTSSTTQPDVAATTLPAAATTTTTLAASTTTTEAVSTAAPAPQNIRVHPEEIGNILATIRYMESRGQYGMPPNKGNASGAYQFIASTWQNYGDYPHAHLAPPAVQDERAAKDVTRFLAQWDNDVSMIPVLWYYPTAARNPALMDIVPLPSAGNTLTIREYQQRWLATFSTISGQPIPTAPQSFLQSLLVMGLAPTPPERSDDLPSIEFPVLGPATIAAPDCRGDATGDRPSDDPAAEQSVADIEAAGLCTEAAPSIVFGVKLQPIRSVIDGIVTAVDDKPRSGRPISVTVTDENGRSYVYTGFNDDNPGTSDGDAPDHLRLTALAEVGINVWAGQIIGFMGDTDPIPVGVRGEVATDSSIFLDPDAIAPHIRLSIHEVDGSPVDAFGPVIDSLFRTGCHNGIGRWSVPAQPTSHDAVTIETTDNDNDIDSEWIITSTGQVQASGWAALISPGEPCEWAPAEHYGPGALGVDDVPSRWAAGLDLPTDVWLQLALAGDGLLTSPLFRF